MLIANLKHSDDLLSLAVFGEMLILLALIAAIIFAISEAFYVFAKEHF
jgi:hypothetical protein